MASTLKLTVIGSDGSIEELSFNQDSIILGSGASANVQLDDEKVSSIHAMLKVEGDAVRVIDLGSETGTRVGGKEVREQELGSGDTIELGRCKVRVTYRDGEAASAPASSGSDEEERQDEPSAAAQPAEATKVERKPKPKSKQVKKKSGGRPRAETAAVAPVGDATEVVKALQPEGNAIDLFAEDVPPEERPLPDSKLLEVVMVWSGTIIGVGHYADDDKHKAVTIGDDPKNDFNISADEIPASVFPLLRKEGDSWVLIVGEEMSLRVRDGDGKVKTLEELKAEGRATRADTEFKAYAYKLSLLDQAVIHIGDTAFVVRFVRPSKRIVTNVWETIDFYFTKVLSTSFVAHAVFIAALIMTPIDTEQLSEDLFTNPNRFAKIILTPEKQEKHKFRDLSGVQEGAKAKKEEGKFGKKEAVKKEAAPSKKGAPIVDVNKREEDRKKVMNSGLLAALNAPDDGAASNVFGPGGLGTGINNALGGVNGAAGMGDAHGVGGLGARGTGPGGGGTALGIGGLGTKGGGRGRGGYGAVDLGGRGKGRTRISPGKTIVMGGLDKEVIARVVRRHQNEIKYCYERELQKDPNLYGKVAVQWVIDGSGAVAQASIAQSTMGNANVENCILTRVRRWKFPQPKGGGIVQVTYPWIFKPSG
ncbi:MAG: TonB family protein [Deltaproteobacteria bacterium]|nr:MAG: TonB family protein [Deltaproteobacteria bacterium]